MAIFLLLALLQDQDDVCVSLADFHFTSLFALDSLSHKLKQHSYKFPNDVKHGEDERPAKARGPAAALPLSFVSLFG